MTYGDLFFRAGDRFSRIQYWTGLAMCVFLRIVDNSQIKLLAGAMPRHGFAGLTWLAPPLSLLLIVYTVFLLVTIHIRRLHDVGRSGLFVLLGLVPGVGAAMLVAVCGFGRGQAGSNRFGSIPCSTRVTPPRPSTGCRCRREPQRLRLRSAVPNTKSQ